IKFHVCLLVLMIILIFMSTIPELSFSLSYTHFAITNSHPDKRATQKVILTIQFIRSFFQFFLKKMEQFSSIILMNFLFLLIHDFQKEIFYIFLLL
ncbi:unnamed protein product, partial [Diamesa tonsa]